MNSPHCFQQFVQDVDVRTTVAVNLPISLSVASSTQSVDVHSDVDLVEPCSGPRMWDVDASQMEKLPLSSVGGGLNAVVAHSAPGIIEDSNGFIHPQGDHAQTQFVFDNQPITDQQSKQFFAGAPENAIASVEVITGVPPAEQGDKTQPGVIQRDHQERPRRRQDLRQRNRQLRIVRDHFGEHYFWGRRQAVGRIHLCQRRAVRPLSRSARIFGDARRWQ